MDKYGVKSTHEAIKNKQMDYISTVYLGKNDLRDKDLKISMIGDVTCDIMGCLKSTLRASTHNNPYYDYNPITESEEPAFSSDSNITVMAVDTCPNALPRDTSEYFGSMLIKHVIAPLFEGKCSSVLDKSTIIREGELTDHFSYLHKLCATTRVLYENSARRNTPHKLPSRTDFHEIF